MVVRIPVEDTVEDTVEETVEETVEDTVEDTVKRYRKYVQQTLGVVWKFVS